MSLHLTNALLALGNGAVFAALALAIVLTYRSSGVLNFATGAIALYAAYTYAYLRTGELIVILPGLPSTVDVGGPWPIPAAIAATLGLAAILGLILDALIFRPIRNAPAMAKAVASLGLIVVLQVLLVQSIGTHPALTGHIFPSGFWTVGEVRISQERVWFAVAVLLIAVGLAAVYRFTRFGLATSAVSETERGAIVSGLSPGRIARSNWVIGTVLAGMAGILIAPISNPAPQSYTLFVVPALAAAVVGGFRSFPLAIVGGLAIGMLQGEFDLLQFQHTWLPQNGLRELVPLAAVLVFLLVRSSPLPERGALTLRTLGRAPRPHHVAIPTVAGFALVLLALVLTEGSWRASVMNSVIYAVICLSLVVVTGYAGQISLAQLTLAGTGAFLLSMLGHDWGIPFPIAPLLAALGSAVIGVVVGLPALRVRGLLVAIVTLSLAVSLEAVWFRNPDLTNNGSGADIANPSLFGIDLGVGTGFAYPRLAFCVMALVVLAGVAIGVALLRRSPLGSAMLAVRASERDAASAGIDPVKTKLIAFGLASFIAGLGGALLAYSQTLATPDSFSAFAGLSLFATAYMAGVTSVSGGLLAGVLAIGGVLWLATDRWVSVGSWYDLLAGLGLIVTVIMNPEGIVGPIHDWLGRRRGRRRGEARSGGAGGQVAATLDRLRPRMRRESSVPVVAGGAQEPGALTLSGLTVVYGGVTAVSDVSMELQPGAIVGLIGPNGAGKSSLIDAVTGFAAASGTVRLNSESLDGLKAFQRVRAGLGRTSQAGGIFDDLTAEENVSLGAWGSSSVGRVDRARLDAACTALGIDHLRQTLGSELTQGQRRLVAVARALVATPRVMLLDEPAAGLDRAETELLAKRLTEVRDAGITILLVDHDMHLVLGLCDQIEVLNFGERIAGGPPSAIRSDPRVVAAYLGEAHATALTEPTTA